MAEIVAEIVGEIVGRVLFEFVFLGIQGAVRSIVRENRTKKSISSTQKHNKSLAIQQTRAVLTASSNISFGNDCERLVNIAFGTSQTFPRMMSTYADVSQYLRDELAKQYPDEYFHIIIGKNKNFGFSIDDDQYFAEIEHARYRVLIFTTKQKSHTKLDTHHANSQMLFVWN
jgi:hypothetical protein